MFSKEDVYDEKRRFVKKLEEALLCLDDVRGIEYRVSDEMHIELVRIDWHGAGDPHEYIDVTANSLRSILREVISLVQEGWAIGQVTNTEREDKLWDELWEDSDERHD